MTCAARTAFLLWMLYWPIVSYAEMYDGLVEDYIRAWEAAVEEVETFKHMAGPDADPDPHTEAQDKWRLLKQKVIDSDMGLSDLDLQDLGLFGNTLDPLVYAGSQRSGHRQKRTMQPSKSSRWTKGIVPYVYTDQVAEKSRNEIQRAFNTYERFSCIRFVPWENNNGTTTNMELQLGHKSYLKFVTIKGCWSFVGNIHKTNGQSISCCGGSTCIHEVGHSLGFWHEQLNGAEERNWWIRVNNQNIKQGQQAAYSQRSHGFSLGYDISSYMHYASWMLGNGNGPTYTILFPGIRARSGFYYMMNEVAVSHECKKLHCSNFTLECVNDGFVTLVDNKCACMCIPGLDPETGCATSYKSEPAGLSLPGGQWAMPMPATGCPDGNFSTGSLVHFGGGGNSVSSPYELKGEVTSNKAEVHFCVSTAAETEVKWPAGNYCIYRKGGTCPKDFKEGSILYANAIQKSKNVNNFTGELPDGIYGHNIGLKFCCRDIGFGIDEMFLPSNKPLALFALPTKNCQSIRGMHSYKTQFVFHNRMDQHFAKIDGHTPAYSKGEHSIFIMDYCYYKPSMSDCGAVIELTPENPTASFATPSGKELDCTWLIKAPKGDNILLNFPEFNVTGMSPDCKEDSLELRYAKPGQQGMKICGSGRDQSTRSILNYMYLRLNTYRNSVSSFHATAQLIQATEQCFLSSDRGATYAGTVNYAENFQMCVPWKDVGHCLHSSFNVKDNNTFLESNYCRLPNYSDGIRPWCYTKAEDCTRTYCDPCLLENRYDVATDCEQKKSKGFCTRGSEAFENCAKTCSENFPLPPPSPPAHKIKCPTPGSVVDGDPIGDLSSSYKAGESVIYKCHTSPAIKHRYCLTSGLWSVMGYVCDVCSEGWTYDKVGSCYKWYSHGQNFDVALATCQELGSALPTAKTDAENKFLLRINHGQSVWLGLSDRAKEGQWKWVDGTALEPHDWNSWKKGEPNNYGNEDCVEVRSDGEWNDINCSGYKKPFVCVMPISKKTVCADFWDECPNLFSDHPEAFASNKEFMELKCAFTGGVCGKNTRTKTNCQLLPSDNCAPVTIGIIYTLTPACPVEDPEEHVIVSTSKKTVSRGEIVQYSCAQGFVSKSGYQLRGCQASGTLTGQTLTCTKGCGGGWKYLESHDTCYKFFSKSMKYADAENLCGSFNATVTTAKDEVENKFVDSFSSRAIWLGLTDREKEGTFVWSDGEKLTGWNKWNQGEPNDFDKNEDCTELSHGWNDYFCDRSLPVVCKIARTDLIVS